MPTDYDKIREENILEYGQGTRHLAFLGSLYTDRTHFVFELLQNAEDAGATRIIFNLFKDRLEVIHDGRPFNEKDVRGVCGVCEGTKDEDLTQIGKFGIGFKSVYAYTKTPEIHSGDQAFRIENFVRPYGIPSRSIGNSSTTLFIFPFNVEGVGPEVACGEIGVRLHNLTARTLLFLRNIKEIEYHLPDSTGGVYIRQEAVRDTARQVAVIGYNNGIDEEENWLIFERPVPGGAEKVRVEVGFRLETDERAGNNPERINKIKDSPLVAYFPTEKATRLGFLIQGPYRTTPSRDNIPKNDEWNKSLVIETAVLLREVLPQIKKLDLLTVSFLEALPIKVLDFPVDSMFYPIFESVRKTLKEENLLPTDDGLFVAARFAKLARVADFRSILNHYQLSQLYGSDRTIKWVSGEITIDRTPDLRIYLISAYGLEMEEVTAEGLARKISATFLALQPDRWFVDFYGFLSGQEALWRAPRWNGDAGGILRGKPILRLEDGNHAIPFKSDGTTPNAYLPPLGETDFPIIMRSIAKEEKSTDFLKRLGLSEPDLFDYIVDKVFPKYANAGNGEVSGISDQEHEADISLIFQAMRSDSETGKAKVARVGIQTPFLKAVNTSGEIHFKKPMEIYLNTEELRQYFCQSSSVQFLYEGYPLKETDLEVWLALGVDCQPRKIMISEGLPAEERERSTRAEKIINCDLEGLDQFLKIIQELEPFEEKRKSAVALWGFLSEYLDQDPRFFQARYEWFYFQRHHKYFDSMALVRLKKSKWVPTKSGILEKPSEISTDDLLDEFATSSELIEILGIAKGCGQSAEDRKHRQAVELGVSLEDIEFLKNHPVEFAKLKAHINAQKEPIFPTRPVVNPERRLEHLSDDFSESPEKEYETRERSVRTTDTMVDPRIWLKNQYTNENDQMLCQICKKEMPFRKRDGEYYFEKKEALSREYFTKEHEAQYLALCPLCAAMYEEFIKNDPNSMEELKGEITRSENSEVPISLGQVHTSIRFVETHYHDLKAIIEGMLWLRGECLNVSEKTHIH